MPPADDLQAFTAAMRAEQTRLHGQVLPLTLAGSAAMALILAVALGPDLEGPALVAWLVGLALSLLLRAVIAMAQRRANGAAATHVRWRRLHRMAFAVHGIVWGLGGALFLTRADPAQRDLIVFALVALTSGGLINTSFDIIAAWLFAAPAASPLLLPLLAPRLPSPPVSVLVAAPLLVIVTLAMLRVQKALAATVRLRIAETERAETALRSAALLDRTGALAQVGAWELDLPSRALRLSTQSRHLLEFDPARARSPGIDDIAALCDAESRTRLAAAFATAERERQDFGLELALTTRSGRAAILRFIGHPHLEGARVVRLEGAMQDVTAQRAADRALANEHALLQQLLRTTAQGFWFLDNQGLTTDLNPAMCRLLGRDRSAVLGRPALDFFSGSDRALMERTLQAERPGEAAGQDGFEIAITRPDGSRLPCLDNASAIVDAAGRRIGSVGIWTDLSAHQDAESTRRIYELVTNSTADMISVVDEREVYLMVNDAWCRGFGLERSQVLGSTPMVVIPALILPERRRATRGAIEQQRVSVVRAPVMLAAGLRHLESTYYPFAESADEIGEEVGQGKGRCIVIITRDVTREEEDRAALAASAARQRALLDAFPGFIAVIDDDARGSLRCSYVNQRMAAIVGRTPEQFVGRELMEVLGPQRAPEVALLVNRARSEGRVAAQAHYPATAFRDALDLEVEHIAGPRQGSGEPSVFAFAIDVTERKRIQAALVVALQQAEGANAAKSLFLSSMSHELRTPMNAILGFGQLLASDADPALSPRQHEFVTEILRGGQHLLALINDLLDLGSIESGELKTDCQWLPLAGVIDEVIGLVRPLAQARQVEIAFNAPAADDPRAWADAKRLRQVLLNLLSNAIKYNRSGGRVDVSTGVRGPWLEIGVRDTGPGLSVQQRERLFKLFERLEARHGSVEGSGIGLALSRRLVEAMNGEIGVESQPGEGSLFMVRLRRSDPARLPAQRAGLGRCKVLYIEDNPVNVMLMEAMLAGVASLVCELDPLVGLERARTQPPDVILLDLQLPGIDGFEVLRRLRADPATQAIPVIAVSANTMLDPAQAAGFEAFLGKPVDIELLLATIGRVMAA